MAAHWVDKVDRTNTFLTIGVFLLGCSFALIALTAFWIIA